MFWQYIHTKTEVIKSRFFIVFKGRTFIFEFKKKRIGCGVNAILNFNNPNRLFFKLHFINYPCKILAI